MTPIHELDRSVWALALGMLGDRNRATAVLLVVFEHVTYKDASTRTDVPTSTISDDRKRFRDRIPLLGEQLSLN